MKVHVSRWLRAQKTTSLSVAEYVLNHQRHSPWCQLTNYFKRKKITGRYKFLIRPVFSTFIKAGDTFVIKFVIFIRNSHHYVFNSSSTSCVWFLILLIDASAITFQIKTSFHQNLNIQRLRIFSFSFNVSLVMKLRKKITISERLPKTTQLFSPLPLVWHNCLVIPWWMLFLDFNSFFLCRLFSKKQ